MLPSDTRCIQLNAISLEYTKTIDVTFHSLALHSHTQVYAICTTINMFSHLISNGFPHNSLQFTTCINYQAELKRSEREINAEEEEEGKKNASGKKTIEINAVVRDFVKFGLEMLSKFQQMNTFHKFSVCKIMSSHAIQV